MNQPIEKPQSLSKQLKDNSHVLVYISAAIGFLTPALYLMGLGFHSGYIGVYGGLSSAFPLSVIDAYVYGYYTITLYFVQLLPYITSIYALLAFLAIPVFLISLAYIAIKIAKRSKSENEPNLPRWVSKVVNFLSPAQNDFIKAVKLAGEELSKISKAAYITLLIISVWIGVTVFSVEKGKELALQSKDAFIKSGCQFNQTTHLSNCVVITTKEDEIISKGLLIALSGNRYGVFNNNGAVISELPEGAKITKKYSKSISP